MLGKTVLNTTVETYKKWRNTLRWMLGTLSHARPAEAVAYPDLPELERFVLHRLAEIDRTVRAGYAGYDYTRILASLGAFLTGDLSAFYFDVRKDALYCDPLSSTTRRGALTAIDAVFDRVAIWLAPVLSFTAEEAWLVRYPSDRGSVHLELFPETPPAWFDEALATRWREVRAARRVVTGALEVERAGKRIGSSLEAAPIVFVADPALKALLDGIDFAEVCITSGVTVEAGEGPPDSYRLPDVPGIAVAPRRAEGRKCARSWKVSPLVVSDPAFPDVTPRDAQALRELRAAGRLA